MEVTPSISPPSKKWLLDWPHLDLEREMLLGFDLSKRSSNRLQNCDLPPPLKLFSPADHDDPSHKAAVISSQQQDPTLVPAVGKVDRWDGNGGEENASLMRALQLSQTRAREAEKKAAEEKRRNQELMRLMVEDSLRLSAYRRCARLLEAEISLLQSKEMKRRRREEEEEEGGDGGAAVGTAAAWCFTLALCLGIAGVGFAVGRYML